MKKYSVLMIIAIFMTVLSCGSSAKSGKVTLNFGMPGSKGKAASAGVPADVTKISVTVTAPDIATIGPLDVDMTNNTLTIEVPAGADRKFDATAFNAESKIIYGGSSSSTIAEGTDTTVIIIMHQYDIIPPSAVQSFTATAGDGEIILNWGESADADIAGYKIMRKEGAYSTDLNDGTQVYTGDALTSTDKNLINGTIYYYTIYAYDGSLNYSAGAQAETKPVFEPLFFAGKDSTNGAELWKTDGTVEGTSLVKNIAPDDLGIMGSDPENFFYYKNKTYFTAYDGTGVKLWVSDGTEAGTVLFGSVALTFNILNFTIYNNNLYFTADDGIHGTELWMTDGASDPVIVSDILIGESAGSDPSDLIVFNGRLYFAATGNIDPQMGTQNRELWVTDGTDLGTVIVKDINLIVSGSTTYGSNPLNFTLYNDKLYFSAAGDIDLGQYNSELWVTDGTKDGTVRVKDINSSIVMGSQGGATYGSFPLNLTVFNNELYFSGSNSSFGSADLTYNAELCVSDGTIDGTVLLTEINNSIGGSVFFADSSYMPEGNSVYGSYPTFLTVFNNRLYFSANNGTTYSYENTELWRTNAAGDGVELVMEINTIGVPDSFSATQGSFPTNLMVFNNKLYFIATSDNVNYSLYVTDGLSVPALFVTTEQFPGLIFPQYESRKMRIYKGKLYFYAGAFAEDGAFYVTDGTAGGTARLADAQSAAN